MSWKNPKNHNSTAIASIFTLFYQFRSVKMTEDPSQPC